MQQHSFEIEAPGGSAKFVVYLHPDTATVAQHQQRPFVVICPGGGYQHTSAREAEPIALALLARGFQVGVLRYSVAPVTYPTALIQLAKAFVLVHQHAASWCVNRRQVHVMGFSAGGHLAGCLATMWFDDILHQALPQHSSIMWQPASAVLCYPVITSGEFAHPGSFASLLGENAKDADMRQRVSLEKCATPTTSPCFIWHTVSDATVPVENSLLFASALQQNGVLFELHIYPEGRHGLALANEQTAPENEPSYIIPAAQNWVDMAARWMHNF